MMEVASLTKHDKLFLGLLCLLVYFIGNNMLAITDPVECNYTLTAKEMLSSGDYLSPRIYGQYWYDKPILFYLELIAAFSVFGLNDFAARFFPALFATAGVLLTYSFGCRLYDKKRGFMAAVLMATSLEYWYIGHAIITDMTLFVLVSLTLIAFYRSWEEKKPLYLYLAFAASGLGVLTKGPIAFCLPGLIILLFLLWQKEVKFLLSLHILGGLAVLIAVCGLWYLPMYQMHGREFIDMFLGLHNYMRATVAEHPRDNVWYYYLMILVAGFFPWSFIGLPAFFRKIGSFIKGNAIPLPAAPRERFLWTWAVTVFFVFNCFATKYITYTFPYMLPLALLMASHWQERIKLWRRVAVGASVLYMGLLFFLAVPLMYENSGKLVMEMYAPYAQEGLTLYTYERKPPQTTSYTFYTGTVVPALRTQEEINDIQSQNNGLNWSLTNVNPIQIIEEIPSGSTFLVLTEKRKIKKMQTELPGQWELLEERTDRRHGDGRNLQLYRCTYQPGSK